MGAARKRKANKYLLTQQKCSAAVHWWKQKAEDEERRARKPAGCRAPRLCPLAKQEEDGREDSGGEGSEEEVEGKTEERQGGIKKGGWSGVLVNNSSGPAQKNTT